MIKINSTHVEKKMYIVHIKINDFFSFKLMMIACHNCTWRKMKKLLKSCLFGQQNLLLHDFHFTQQKVDKMHVVMWNWWNTVCIMQCSSFFLFCLPLFPHKKPLNIFHSKQNFSLWIHRLHVWTTTTICIHKNGLYLDNEQFLLNYTFN